MSIEPLIGGLILLCPTREAFFTASSIEPLIGGLRRSSCCADQSLRPIEPLIGGLILDNKVEINSSNAIEPLIGGLILSAFSYTSTAYTY